MRARTWFVRRPRTAFWLVVASPKVPDLYQEVDRPRPIAVAVALAEGPLVRPNKVSLEVEALLEEEIGRRPIGLNTVPAIRLCKRRLAVAWALDATVEAVDIAGPEETILQISIAVVSGAS